MNDMGLSARWLLFGIEPGAPPPYSVRIGIESTRGDFQILGDMEIAPCQTIIEMIERGLVCIQVLGISISPQFCLIYPRHSVSGQLEEEMHQIAWGIKDEADSRNWNFDRELPLPMTHVP